VTREQHNRRDDDHRRHSLTPPAEPESLEYDLAWEQAEQHTIIGALSGSLAHELSNPLCGIRSVLERMVRKPALDDAERDLLHLALRQCDHMRHLLHELQDFIAPNSGQQSLFALDQTLDTVLLLMRKHLTICGCTVQFIRPPQPLLLYGEQSRLRQMLVQLLMLACCRKPLSGGCHLRIHADCTGSRTQVAFRFQINPGATEHLQQLLTTLCTPSATEATRCLHGILHHHGGELYRPQITEGIESLILSLPTHRNEEQR
jgi:nitrogen-specific signal transduction histidine kinase